jgi:hypothetical protein
MNRAHDYGSATKYGALRPVTTGNYPVFKTSRLIEEIIDALVHSGPEDYLLLSGSSTIAGICQVVWIQLHGKCKFLLWSRDEDSYVVRVIDKPAIVLLIEETKDKLFGRQRAAG